MSDKVAGMTAEEIVRFLQESIEKHCGRLPSCPEVVFDSDTFLIEAHQVVGDICERFGLYSKPDEDWEDE